VSLVVSVRAKLFVWFCVTGVTPVFHAYNKHRPYFRCFDRKLASAGTLFIERDGFAAPDLFRVQRI